MVLVLCKQRVLIKWLMATRLLVIIVFKLLSAILMKSQIDSQEESGLLFWLFVGNYCDHV